MFKILKRYAFRFFYNRLGIREKVKFINVICAEFELNVICKYTKQRLLFVPPNDGALKKLVVDHSYNDQEIIDWICRIIPASQNCVDIGANVGFWTIPLASSRSSAGKVGKVFAFEPTPSTQAILRLNLNLNGFNEDRVKLFDCALGNQPGSARLTCFDGPHQSCGWNTLGNPTKLSSDAASSYTTVEVPVRTLDQVWVELGRPSIGFVKMDVEGFEPMVFEGGVEFFKAQGKQRDFIGLIEINKTALVSCGKNVTDLYSWISEVGLVPASVDFSANDAPVIKVVSEREFLSIVKGDVLLLPPNSSRLPSA